MTLRIFALSCLFLAVACNKEKEEFTYKEVVEIYSIQGARVGKEREEIIKKYNLSNIKVKNQFYSQLSELSSDKDKWKQFLEDASIYSESAYKDDKN